MLMIFAPALGFVSSFDIRWTSFTGMGSNCITFLDKTPRFDSLAAQVRFAITPVFSLDAVYRNRQHLHHISPQNSRFGLTAEQCNCN